MEPKEHCKPQCVHKRWREREKEREKELVLVQHCTEVSETEPNKETLSSSQTGCRTLKSTNKSEETWQTLAERTEQVRLKLRARDVRVDRGYCGGNNRGSYVG